MNGSVPALDSRLRGNDKPFVQHFYKLIGDNKVDSDASSGPSAQHMQAVLGAAWQQAMAAASSAMAAPPAGLAQPAFTPPTLSWDAAQLQALQQQYLQEASALWNQTLTPGDAPPMTDRRFAAPAWQNNGVSRFSAAAYLLNARTLMALADALQGDEKTKARMRFAVEQWTAATAPSNFLVSNAEALQKVLDTQGESIAQGMTNLLHDLRQGHVAMTDESLFALEKNLATTAGAVVFENEFFQLLQYQPLTPEVYTTPLLLVPPCINKFYILDLQQGNSFIRYAVEQGHSTFVMSWRNPDASMAQKTWDDYIEQGVMQAIAVVQDITGAQKINTLGFCVGGTLLATALSVLGARGQKPAASLTLLTTLLDFSDTGILDIFIDEKSVQYREAEMGQGGLLPGRDLALTFSFLRPNDLVWNYVVGNYLKGETPPAFDLLYWNTDTTNLPGPFYAWYLRNTYFENNLIQPGKTVVCGQPVDFRRLDMPSYIYGSREDHIVPIASAYASTQHLPGEKRFVMGASGHIAGVINPPAKKKRSYWTDQAGPGAKFPAEHSAWLQAATEHPGSWWTDWADWLRGHAGARVAAPTDLGSAKYPVLEAAPGRYVKVKA